MKKTVLIALCLTVVLTLSAYAESAATAGDKTDSKACPFTMGKEAKADKADGPVNKICPVMGGKVSADSPTVNYKGNIIGFCCPGCVEKFKADPEKYLDKLNLKEKKCIIKCPNCGAEIDLKNERACKMQEK